MEPEIRKLSSFLEGPLFTMLPTPTREIKSGEEIVEYLNKNNLTIIGLEVVSNLTRQLNAKEKLMEEEREEMKKEMKKMEIRKDLFMANQTKLVDCFRKVAEITEFKESLGSEKSKCVLVGQSCLDRFYDHVKSAFEQGSQLKEAPSSSSSSAVSSISTSKWEVEDKPKVKRAKRAIIYSSDDEEDNIQEIMAPKQPVKVIKPKVDFVLPAPPLPARSTKKLSLSCSSLSSRSCTKWRCVNCNARCDSKKDYNDHCKIVRRVLAKLKDHGVHGSQLLSKKSSYRSGVPVRPSAPVENKLLSRNEIKKEFCDDDIIGKEKDKVAECLSKSVKCQVCGDGFGNIAARNFHTKKKHSGN